MSPEVWSHVPPTAPGSYRWRKSAKWEPITREVVNSNIANFQREALENQRGLAD